MITNLTTGKTPNAGQMEGALFTSPNEEATMVVPSLRIHHNVYGSGIHRGRSYGPRLHAHVVAEYYERFQSIADLLDSEQQPFLFPLGADSILTLT